MGYFSDGLLLMAIGVGVVFTFLTLLIFAIQLMSFIVQKYFPEAPEPPPQNSLTSSEQNTMLAAAIAAVHHYRYQHKKIK